MISRKLKACRLIIIAALGCCSVILAVMFSGRQEVLAGISSCEQNKELANKKHAMTNR